MPQLREPDQYAPVTTAAGPAFAAFNGNGLRYLALGTDAARFEAQYQTRFGRAPLRSARLPEPIATAAANGTPVEVDLSDETPFTQAVLTITRDIPPGEVRTYSWVAAAIGRPGAVRAVGSALGRNPVPVFVPCHRVVRSDGRIGDYALGSELKRKLLAGEAAAVAAAR